MALLSLNGRSDFIETGLQRRSMRLIPLRVKRIGRTITRLNGFTRVGWPKSGLKRFKTAFGRTRWDLKMMHSAARVFARGTVTGCPETSFVHSLGVGMHHLYQTDAHQLLRERRSEFRFDIEIGRIDFSAFGGLGVLREVGQLFDTRFVGSEINYEAQHWHLNSFSRFGLRRAEISRYTNFSAGLNLLGKLTADVDLGYLYWRTHRNTLIFPAPQQLSILPKGRMARFCRTRR